MADNNLRQELNEKSLDIRADMLDPYFELMKDPEFTKLFMTGLAKKIQTQKNMLKSKLLLKMQDL